ncbi:UNVERIFIED_ORG: hypothetical protein CLV66_1217 [Actinomadura viridilutea]
MSQRPQRQSRSSTLPPAPRPPRRRCRAWSAGTGIVAARCRAGAGGHGSPGRKRPHRPAPVSGRVRERPGLRRATLMPTITALNRRASPRWPAVTTTRQRHLPPARRGQMRRGRQPTAVAAQRVVDRLGEHAAGRLALPRTVPLGPGGVPVGQCMMWSRRLPAGLIIPAASARALRGDRDAPGRLHAAGGRTARRPPARIRSRRARHATAPVRARRRILSMSCRLVHVDGRPGRRATAAAAPGPLSARRSGRTAWSRLEWP